MKIIANEFVLPLAEWRECHASHLAILPGGEILCVYFYGWREGRDDVRIYASRRTPDGRWEDPVPITEDDGVPHWNPVLHLAEDGILTLYYKVGKTIANWVTRCMVSRDGGRTWSKSRELVEGDVGGGRGPVRNKILRLSDGSLLAPASTEQGEWRCFFDRSFDGGETWERGEDVRLPESILSRYPSVKGKGIIQPTLWESPEGIHALLRSTEGSVYRTDSKDAVHWCEPYAIDLPNNNSGIDAERLPDGRVVLACNPVSKNWGLRTPISLYVSEDNGHTFSLLSHMTTMQGEYSYPAVIWRDGLLHVTYTWNRKSIQYFCFADI